VKISGFTFVRNAVKLQYPVVESIQSILPIVDEFVVNIGESDDDTSGLVRRIGSPKIRIIESKWNPHVATGGYVLAQQTNVALFNCTGEWAIYLQADEAIHEADHPRLLELMERYRGNDDIEGLLLERVTFYGDYQTMVVAHPFLRDLACRVVKPHRFVLSRGDAAGFTVHPKYKEGGRRIRAVDTGLTVFHYCDVRPPHVSASFKKEKDKLWAGNPSTGSDDRYASFPRQFLSEYRGGHPAPMRDRIAQSGPPLEQDSPHWRTELTRRERKVYWRSKLTEWLGRRALPLSAGDRIIASHRTRYITGGHGG
jgi:glycosyltransferase involved in cell wall biosynthesis